MDVQPSRFVWYELMSRNVPDSARFYARVVGWTSRDGSRPNQPYTLFSAGEALAAGLLPLPPGLAARGVAPHWTGYIGVRDLPAILPRLVKAGGMLIHGPQSVPGVGRLAVVSDLHGAVFSLLQQEPGLSGPPPAPPGTPGRIGWHELQAANGEAAFAFYAGLFGWTKAQATDIGTLGVYQTFNTGDVWAGGIMTRWSDTTRPFWLYYVNVDSAAAAASRITAAGGTDLKGPIQVPGGNWIVQARDPQGALFAVVSTSP
jgi:predicted enzyme related to lactoylglutathione lyase